MPSIREWWEPSESAVAGSHFDSERLDAVAVARGINERPRRGWKYTYVVEHIRYHGRGIRLGTGCGHGLRARLRHLSCLLEHRAGGPERVHLLLAEDHRNRRREHRLDRRIGTGGRRPHQRRTGGA